MGAGSRLEPAGPRTNDSTAHSRGCFSSSPPGCSVRHPRSGASLSWHAALLQPACRGGFDGRPARKRENGGFRREGEPRRGWLVWLSGLVPGGVSSFWRAAPGRDSGQQADPGRDRPLPRVPRPRVGAPHRPARRPRPRPCRPGRLPRDAPRDGEPRAPRPRLRPRCRSRPRRRHPPLLLLPRFPAEHVHRTAHR